MREKVSFLVVLLLAVLSLFACSPEPPPFERAVEANQVDGGRDVVVVDSQPEPDKPLSGCEPGKHRRCYNGPAGTEDVGVCKAGLQYCGSDRTWGSCLGQVSPQVETCGDKKDNDCDGLVDEACGCQFGQRRSCYSGPAGTEGVGLCKGGLQTCNSYGKWGSCVGEVTPKAEVCNNSNDDDCNGQIDDGCGESCAAGSQPRSCYTGPASTKGVGICKPGIQVCENGKWGTCLAEVLPASRETCGNNLDDDCNGKVDDGCGTAVCTPGATQVCYTGPAGTQTSGICKEGVQVCGASGHWGACAGEVLPKKEDCGNTLDDDCDGTINNGCECVSDQSEECYTYGSGCTWDSVRKNYVCNGICRAGRRTCVDGKWGTCAGQRAPSYKEVLNGLDDDCNGVVDDCKPYTPNSC